LFSEATDTPAIMTKKNHKHLEIALHNEQTSKYLYNDANYNEILTSKICKHIGVTPGSAETSKAVKAARHEHPKGLALTDFENPATCFVIMPPASFLAGQSILLQVSDHQNSGEADDSCKNGNISSEPFVTHQQIDIPSGIFPHILHSAIIAQ